MVLPMQVIEPLGLTVGSVRIAAAIYEDKCKTILEGLQQVGKLKKAAVCN